MTPEELEPAFKGRLHLAPLWQKISSGASEFTPEEQVEIMVAEARVYQERGDFPRTFEKANAALRLGQECGYTDGIVAALTESAIANYVANDHDASVQLAMKALKYSEHAPEAPLAYLALAACAYDSNDWGQAEKYFDLAIRRSRALGQISQLSMVLRYHSWLYRDRGQFDLALAAMDEYKRLRIEMGLVPERYPMGRSWIYVLTNNRLAARQALLELEPFAATSSVRACVYHISLGYLAMDEDDFERAERELQQVRALAETTGIGKINHWMRAAYSRLRRLQSDASGAMSWANEALLFAQRYTSRFEEGIALVERARAWWMLDEFASTDKDLLAALDIAQTLGAEFLAAEATFLLAALRHQQKSPDANETWLDAARRIKIGGYGFILERERTLAFPLIAAQSRSRDPVVRASAEAMLDHLAKIAPLPLRVHGLGRFEVWQGRKKIPDREWQKRSAGELFRFMLLQPRHAAVRDLIFESLCPDQTPEAARTFLHHATSTLRHILEPELPEKFPSRYLIVEGEEVELRLPSGSSLDWEDFEQGLSGGADEKFLELYQGDLFALDRYADCATDDRERLAELHRRALLSLGQRKLDENKPLVALDACRAVLTTDAWREDAVLIAMKACLALNDRPGALRFYRDLERHLQADLHLAPRQDLQDLASSIRK